MPILRFFKCNLQNRTPLYFPQAILKTWRMKISVLGRTSFSPPTRKFTRHSSLLTFMDSLGLAMLQIHRPFLGFFKVHIFTSNAHTFLSMNKIKIINLRPSQLIPIAHWSRFEFSTQAAKQVGAGHHVVWGCLLFHGLLLHVNQQNTCTGHSGFIINTDYYG